MNRQLVERAVAELVPYARNARTHSEAQIDQIAASIREFGWTNPVLVDGNDIIAGHGRLRAAVKLGMAAVPCLELAGLSEVQKQAYILADNKLALNAGWDAELLKLELTDLKALDFDLGLVGFSDTELDGILGPTGGLTDPDDVPDAPVVPVAVAGDVWVCGRHRVSCGDSTKAEDVERLLAGVKPHLMVTDPPYGVEYDATWRGKAGYATLGKTRTGKVASDDRADWREVWALFPGDVAYVWHGGLHSALVAESLIATEFDLRAQIIWVKSVMVMGRGDYHWQHEPCWYAVRNGKVGRWSGDRTQTTAWTIASPLHIMSGSKEEKTPHPTQKPAEAMRRPVENNSSLGQAVYDPFLGSGTTLIACEQTGRACYGQELMPTYVDVAIQRWQNFTGEKAVRESDGRTYDEARIKTEADVPADHQRQPAGQAAQPKRADPGRQPARAAGVAD